VRRLARQKDVNLDRLVGTGPRGRILKTDVEAAAESSAVTYKAEPAPSPDRPVKTDAVTSPTRTLRQRLSGARLVSARNLHDSVQRSVTTTTTFEVTGDGLRNLIASLVPEAQARQLKLSPLHIIAKCVGAALIRHERFNATVDEESQEIVFREGVDLGIAVATPDRLLVPVVRSVEKRLLFDLVRQIDDYSERARQGQLKVAELSGGSFTLSSTGGMERVTVLSTRPIINPPQTATLWVSRIIDRPRVIDGQLSAGPMLSCSLSFDHRYVDGAEAVHFINDLGSYLEHPERALG
jgi:pyruvate dehydrogenase E2 component (dihydrolipoamide acetyltransferase)